MVGETVVAQQTPLAVTVAPPFAVMFPPLVAVVWVIAEAAVVEIVGTTVYTGLVVKVNSVP